MLETYSPSAASRPLLLSHREPQEQARHGSSIRCEHRLAFLDEARPRLVSVYQHWCPEWDGSSLHARSPLAVADPTYLLQRFDACPIVTLYTPGRHLCDQTS